MSVIGAGTVSKIPEQKWNVTTAGRVFHDKKCPGIGV